MRIALLSVPFLPQIGGAEFVVHHLAQTWSEQGHEVLVINCTTDVPSVQGARYSVRRLPLLRGSTRYGYHRFPFAAYAVRNLKRLLVEFSPDLVSAHQAYPTAVWLAMLDPVPRFIVTCHGQDITRQPWGFRAVYGVDMLLADALGRSAAVIAISRHARELIEGLGIEPTRIADIPNGVEIARFEQQAEFHLRGKLDLPRDAALIVSVGRNHPAKAFDTGLRAFSRVVRETQDAHYLVVGKDTNQWAGLVRDLGIRDRVTFHPGLYGEELVAAYQQSDIYLSCSISETFPLAMLEAMAAGLPVVVTDVGGHSDVVESDSNGLLVEAGAIDGIGAALTRLLDDAELRKRLGEAGQRTAQRFDWDRVSRLYLECA